MPNVSIDIMLAFAAPFPAADVDWRIQHAVKDKLRGLAVPYVKSRAIQSRLDQVVGPYNWKAEYKLWHSLTNTASQLCGISVYCAERNEWVQKWDGAENTDIEPVKGGISDSFKRAAVLWGIGRYLYNMSAVWVEIEQRGKNYVITDNGLKQLDGIYEKTVKSPVSAALPPAVIPPEPPAFEYAVRAVEQRRFSSGDGMVLKLKSADGKKQVEAFLEKADGTLSEGVRLKNVKLRLIDNSGYKCNIIDAYEVA